MPRLPDPDALTASEAAEFRTLIADIKDMAALTTEDIAERLEDDPDAFESAVRRVSNAMTRSRTLLPKNAYAVLVATKPGSRHPDAARRRNDYFTKQRLSYGWLARYEARLLLPAVFIPPHEVLRLSEYLAAGIAKSPKARDRLTTQLRKRLEGCAEDGERVLRKMAESWRVSAQLVAMRHSFDHLMRDELERLQARFERDHAQFRLLYDSVRSQGGHWPRTVKKWRPPAWSDRAADTEATLMSLVRLLFPEIVIGNAKRGAHSSSMKSAPK